MVYRGEVLDDGSDFIVVETATAPVLVDMKLTLGPYGTVEVSMAIGQARELARHLTGAINTLTSD